ncbi:uncharacterized protein FFB20_00605 [Fusarium fujikuroi]|nr:uncharacterized protein FFB20_00605 [Fusarium fujikuroi]
MYKSGVRVKDIADSAGLSRHAIYGIIRRGRAQESCKDKPRSGRPSALSDQDKSHIKILIKNNPFISYRDIISRARLRASPKTIRRWLIDEKIQHRLALQRPFLTEEAAQLRKSFADKYRHEDESFWYSWWFSDEVTIDRTDGDYTKARDFTRIKSKPADGLPDLSPVENLWKVLKERICKTYPEIAAYPKSAEAIDRLIAAAEELWTEIEDDVVKNVIKSMPDRLNECYRANGYYTKY